MKKILILDEYEDKLSLNPTSLLSAGYDVTLRKSQTKTLLLLRESNWDLLILRLENWDNKESLLRSLADFDSSLKIILCSFENQFEWMNESCKFLKFKESQILPLSSKELLNLVRSSFTLKK